MIDDCSVTVQGGMYGIKISQKGNGMFNKVSAIPKAAICPNCGNVIFYIDEFKQFKK
jgi:ribosomal protein L28